MDTSNDLKNLEFQLKKKVISTESFKRGGTFDTSKNITNIHKNISNLAGHLRKVVIRVGNLEKVVKNNSRKITSLKNISKLQGPQIRGTNIGAKLPGGSVQSVDKDIAAITAAVISIHETIKQQQNLLAGSIESDRRKKEKEKGAAAESKLEKRFEGLKKIAEKIIAPVKSILDKIIDFFINILLGRVVIKLLDWLADPKNATKVKSIIRFLGDWWPALLGAYILFGNSFGGLIRSTVGIVGRFIFQIGKVAIPQLLRVIAANPIASLVVGGAAAVGIGAYTASQQNEQKREGVKPGQGIPGAPQLQREQVLQRGLGGMFNGGGFARAYSGGGLSSGFVSGEKGVDKIPAMLSDGEFVMSRGAVAKYGVDTLEEMNAAGGGTNKPKIMGGKTYAVSGGPIGRTLPGRNGEGSNGSLAQLRENINNFFRGKGGGPNFDIGNPSTWRGGSGGTSVSGGGGSGGFLGGLGYLGRVANQVPKIASKATAAAAPAVGYAGRALNQAAKMAAPTLSRAGRVAGEVKKRAIDPTINAAKNLAKKASGFDFKGLGALSSSISGAATEALPALLSSTLGISRTDKSISEDMQKQLLQARATAAKRGRNYVDYKDYDGGGILPGGFTAGGLTMGRIADKEWKRDAQGRIIGLRQVYDTNRSAKEAWNQGMQGFGQFGSSLMKGKLNKEALGRGIYKPFEALLALTQDRGKTMHDVNFSEKVLGFKPGREVLNDTQKRMIAGQKNREALQAKRPWWDTMGMFGGASAEMQRQKEEESKKAGLSGQYGRYAAPSQQVNFSRPSNTGVKPVKPPTKPQAKVVYGSPVPSRLKSKPGATPKSSVPNFTAGAPGMRSKQQTLGLMR